MGVSYSAVAGQPNCYNQTTQGNNGLPSQTTKYCKGDPGFVQANWDQAYQPTASNTVVEATPIASPSCPQPSCPQPVCPSCPACPTCPTPSCPACPVPDYRTQNLEIAGLGVTVVILLVVVVVLVTRARR